MIPRALIARRVAATATVLAGAAVVVLLVIQLNAPTTLAARLVGYHSGADDRQIVVTAVLTRADSIKTVSNKQDSTSVRVTVLVDRRRGTYPLDLLFVDVPIVLASPLSDRGVFDGDEKPLPVRAPP